jgi:hypothetical protein
MHDGRSSVPCEEPAVEKMSRDADRHDPHQALFSNLERERRLKELKQTDAHLHEKEILILVSK